jgi:hypothetical protein
VFWYCEEEACYLRVFEIMDDVDIDWSVVAISNISKAKQFSAVGGFDGLFYESIEVFDSELLCHRTIIWSNQGISRE